MGTKKSYSRRKFVKGMAQGGLMAGAAPFIITRKPFKESVILEPANIIESKKVSANDKIRLGVIGIRNYWLYQYQFCLVG